MKLSEIKKIVKEETGLVLRERKDKRSRSSFFVKEVINLIDTSSIKLEKNKVLKQKNYKCNLD